MTAPLTQTTGRRKRSVARARLRPGTGTIMINGKTFEEYFPTDAQRMVVDEPLRVAEALESYDIDASIHGSGWICLRPNDTRSLSESNLSTLTLISSPTWKSSPGWATRP